VTRYGVCKFLGRTDPRYPDATRPGLRTAAVHIQLNGCGQADALVSLMAAADNPVFAAAVRNWGPSQSPH
jgi:hypothetical protein